MFLPRSLHCFALRSEYTDFQFSTLMSKVLYVFLLEVILLCMKWHLNVGFDLQFPATNDVAYLFLSLLAICISSLSNAI